MDNKQDIASMSYRDAGLELEQVVRSLEGGQLELEEALEQYNRGVALIKDLRKRLADAEQQVEKLLEEADAQSEKEV